MDESFLIHLSRDCWPWDAHEYCLAHGNEVLKD